MNEKLLIGDDEEMGAKMTWRKALRHNGGFKVINKTFRGQTYCIWLLIVSAVILLFIFYLFPKTEHRLVLRNMYYNHTYPLSNPIKTEEMHTFRIGIITDLDTNSKSLTDPNTWYALFKKGYISYSPKTKSIVVTWDENQPTKLTTSYSLKGRGMELSELVVFNGKLLTFDDRTGLIYEIVNDRAIPWVILMEGDGKNAKGFKSEWATVKDGMLYVGSMGKEWTTAEGKFENYNPMYIKSVTPQGEVIHVNWVEQYKRIREMLDIKWPGYMIHESGMWSNVHKKWFFLPRRCSKETYDEVTDERMGCSVLISADADVYNLKVVKLPNLTTTRGFSTFKFVPSSNDEVIVALRTEELDGKTSTYITAFTIDGKILLEDTMVSDSMKYEGLEFI